VSSPNLVLYGTPLSGHTHRVELLMAQLGLNYEYREARSEFRKSPEFRAISPQGQIPVLIDDGRVVPDSNAILIERTRWRGRVSSYREVSCL